MIAFIVILLFIIVIGIGLFKTNRPLIRMENVTSQSTNKKGIVADIIDKSPTRLIKPKNSTRVTFNPIVTKRFVDVDLPVEATGMPDGIISEKTMKLN